MKARLRDVDNHGVHYQALMFVCPGCAEVAGGGSGLHMLPVNTSEHSPSWTFDGDLDAPTLAPSIKTTWGDKTLCHCYLRAGVFQFLKDSTHSFAGQNVPMPDLLDWAAELGSTTED